MNTLFDYIDGAIVTPVLVFCGIVGIILKEWIPADNRIIPTVLPILGAIITCLYLGSATFDNVLSGVITGWGSTGVYEMVKNWFKKKYVASVMTDEEAKEALNEHPELLMEVEGEER